MKGITMTVGLIFISNANTPYGVKEMISAAAHALRVAPEFQVNLNIGWQPDTLSSVASCSVWVVHNSASYSPEFTEKILTKLKAVAPSSAVVVMKQDDHLAPSQFDKLFLDFGVDAVTTYLDEEQWPHVYPLATAAGIRFCQVHVAYITKSLLDRPATSLPNMRIATYRGSPQPPQLGHLGWDKVLLPERLRSFEGRDRVKAWIFDASSEWQARAYGRAWFDLLNNSRVVFSTESGSNCFDLDGELGRQTEKFEADHGKLLWSEPKQLARYSDEVLSNFEGNVRGGTFSPRNLEAGILGRPQVLVRGGYGGIFGGFESQLMVDPMLTELPNVLEKFESKAEAAVIATDVREALLANESLRVEVYARKLSELVESLQPAPDLYAESTNEDLQVFREEIDCLLVSPSPYSADPRTSWWENSLTQEGIKFSTLEWLGDGRPGAGWAFVGLQTRSKNTQRASESMVIECPEIFLLMLEAARLTDSPIRWRSRRMLRMLYDLDNLWLASPPPYVIACDLESAAVTAILWGRSSEILYDAQEMPAEQLEDATEAGREIFSAIEELALKRVSMSVTISPGAAQYYRESYGIDAGVVPNFPPRRPAVQEHHFSLAAPQSIIRFVFFGRWAESRGILEMVDSWPSDPRKRELHLFIKGAPESLQRKSKRLRALGIFLQTPIDESQIQSTLEKFDVGMLPYDYPYPYNHCSPNKFGQYLDAGLLVLATATPFYGDLIDELKIGHVFSWNDPGGFAEAVLKFSEFNPGDSVNFENVVRARAGLHWDAYADRVVKSFFATDAPGRAETTARSFAIGARFAQANSPRSVSIRRWLACVPRFVSGFPRTWLAAAYHRSGLGRVLALRKRLTPTIWKLKVNRRKSFFLE